MERPSSLTICGILNLVFGVSGFFALLATTALFTTKVGAANPVVPFMQSSPVYAGWLKISLILGLFASLALIAAGIGLLRVKPWARVLSLAYAVYAILSGITGIAITLGFLLPPMFQNAAHAEGPEGAQKIGAAIGAAIGGSVGGCVGTFYPIALLIILTRPSVMAAFRRPPPFTVRAAD
jgi:hypothetical protein